MLRLGMQAEWKFSRNKILVFTIICLLAVSVGYLLIRQTMAPQATLPKGTSNTTIPSETYGMKEYTDPTYHFSFWYPSALQVTATTTSDAVSFPGGIAVETLEVGPLGGTSIVVVNSPTSMITDEPADHASPISQTEYFYDSASGLWMVAYPQGTMSGGPDATTTADISKTTISGLLMLPSGKRFDTTIISLSTTRFLVISDGGGSSFTYQLADTVTQASMAVATSTEEAALQAESAAYNLYK